jgi:hypothetical protein
MSWVKRLVIASGAESTGTTARGTGAGCASARFRKNPPRSEADSARREAYLIIVCIEILLSLINRKKSHSDSATGLEKTVPQSVIDVVCGY